MQQETINNTLAELNQTSADITGSLLAGTDGAVLAVALSSAVQADQLAAVYSGVIALGVEAATLLQLDQPEQILVKSQDGYQLLTPVGDGAILALALKPSAKPGLIMMDAQRAAEVLRTVI